MKNKDKTKLNFVNIREKISISILLRLVRTSMILEFNLLLAIMLNYKFNKKNK